MLGGDHYNTVSTLRTIDSGCRGVLQDLNTLDIRWIYEVGAVTNHNTIYYVERRSITMDSSDTADTDGGLTVRRTVLLRNQHTSSSTLQGLTDVCRNALHNCFLVNGSNRTRDVALLHCTITYDYYVVQHLCIFFQHNCNVGFASNFYALWYITNIRDVQGSI